MMKKTDSDHKEVDIELEGLDEDNSDSMSSHD
jgi:hypothetical protein